MRRPIKIGIAVLAVMALLPIVLTIMLFVGWSPFTPPQFVRREMELPNHGSLIVDGNARGRSEHGFSQRAGYRPPGSDKIEWFGEVSDGVEPQVYEAGPLLVVIDVPAAQLYIRTAEENWKSLALIFPDDLGPFPISYYAEKNGLTTTEVSRISELGDKRQRKYPTTYIQSFDPETRDLKCSYQIDNKRSWPLHLQLSPDGTHLALIEIGESCP